MNSRAKGAKGERELASILRDYGYEARRGQQYSGANGDADGTVGKTSAERHFDALPPLLQQVIATPSQLAEWEMLKDSEINTVIQSNFMRSYRARAKDAKDWAALPMDIKQAVEGYRRGLILEEARKMLDGD